MSYQGCTCFWLEPTGRVRLSLRRFTFSPPRSNPDAYAKLCPVAERTGCDASTALDVYLPLRMQHDEYGPTMESVPEADRPGHDDSRWPAACASCGEAFDPAAEWQVNQQEEYTRSDNGEVVHMRNPIGEEYAGALFDAWWLHGRPSSDGLGHVGSDGIALIAICPNGLPWDVDGPATGGGRWTRTGDPRQPGTLTISPSIAIGKPDGPRHYHGFLQGGAFTAG